jgi:hypothetical protein
MITVTFVFADAPGERNSSIWRSLWPVEALHRAGHDARLFFRNHWLQRDAKAFQAGVNSQVIVYERVLTNEVAEDMRFWKRHGKRIVVDFDDAYQLMPPTVATYRNWYGPKSDFGEPLLDSLRRNLPLADLLHTPSLLLCEDWAGIAAQTALMPNYPALNANPNWRVPYPIRDWRQLGWGGGGSHILSWQNSNILPAVYNERMLLLGGGEMVRKMLPKARHIPFMAPEIWPYELGRVGIGLAPLAGEYDRRRSWIKCLEYGAKGIPWIASDMEPYRESKGGSLVQNDAGAWRDAIMTLRGDRALYEQLAQEGREWAWAQDIDAHIEERVRLYESLL